MADDVACSDGTELFVVRNPETGEQMFHYEWNGWLWCENEQKPFDWETGEVECPHCGDTFRSPHSDTEHEATDD